MEDTLVTIIMPVYNAELYLRDAIESVLAQSYKKFIFMIINDGSTDQSETIILEYKDERIQYISNEENLGIVKAKCKNVFFTDTFIENVYAPDDSKRKEIIQKKLAEFSQAQLIITDRLHGMILAYLSKTPCIVLSNYNYKIEGVYEWIKEIEWVVYTDKIEKIDSLTDELMGKTFIKDSKKLEYKTLEKQLDSWVKQWR